MKIDTKEIASILDSCYSKSDIEYIQGHIQRLASLYAPKFKIKGDSLDQEDSILILYGDSFQKKGQSHLKSLNDFVETYCKGTINSVHLLPFYPFTSDDGFSVLDYFQVNPDFGDWNDIKEISNHANLMFDAVVNHISKSSNWFKGYLAGDERYRNYFLNVDPSKDLSMVVRPRALPLLSPFKNHKDEQLHIWTTFSEDQVDLNYQAPEVFVAVLEVLLFYVSQGAKFIRLDAIGFLWKKLGTTCIHLEETHKVIQAYRAILDQLKANSILISETNVPHKENISYFGDGTNEAHMVYNFTLPPILAYSLLKQDTSTLTAWANSLELPSSQTCFFNFTASHDGVGVRPLQGIVPDHEINELAEMAIENGGFVNYKNNADGSQSPYELNCSYIDLLTHPNDSDALRLRRFMLTQSVMLAMPGVPGIYYHSLLGSRNDRQAALESGINRRINRKKFHLEELESELKNESSFRNLVFSNYTQLLDIRKGEGLFNPFGAAKYHEEKGLFIIERFSENERLWAIHNFTDQPRAINAMTKAALNLISDNEITSDVWEVGPFGYLWIKESRK